MKKKKAKGKTITYTYILKGRVVSKKEGKQKTMIKREKKEEEKGEGGK